MASYTKSAYKITSPLDGGERWGGWEEAVQRALATAAGCERYAVGLSRVQTAIVTFSIGQFTGVQ